MYNLPFYDILREKCDKKVVPMLFIEMIGRSHSREFVTKQYCPIWMTFHSNILQSGKYTAAKHPPPYLINYRIVPERLRLLHKRKRQQKLPYFHYVHSTLSEIIAPIFTFIFVQGTQVSIKISVEILVVTFHIVPPAR